MFRIIRIVVTVVFIITTVVYGWVIYSEKFRTDNSVPVITVDSEEIEVELGASDSDLLRGVTAFDETDGDLSANVIIESISKFTSRGVCRVNYAVSDSDNHVSTASRKVIYKNYTSPKFSMNSSLCFSIYDRIVVNGVVSAKDCIEGDISDKIIITSDDFNSGAAGVYTLQAQVTSSRGDSVGIELPLIVENRPSGAPKINLKNYLIYLEQGKHIDFKSYIKSVTDASDKSISPDIHIESNLNSDEPGVYTVDYYATDADGRQGHTIMMIVVEDNAQ